MKARGIYRRGGIFWIQICIGGRKVRMSTGIRTGSHKGVPKEVHEFYAKKVVEFGQGAPLEGAAVRFEDLREALFLRYRAEQRFESLRNADFCFKRLAKRFSGWKASALTKNAILAYAVERRDVDRAAVATINLELRMLRRAFSLVDDRFPHPPKIAQLPGANKRRGTVPAAVLTEIMANLAEHYADLVWFLRLVGWRSSEGRKLEWRHVDWESNALRLEKTKSGKPRERAFGSDPSLLALLQKRRAAEPLSNYVFARPDGSQITRPAFLSAWSAAAAAVGYQGGAHNLRRTRVQEQELQGCPITVGMAMVGIETPSIYRDYSAVSVREQEEWLRKAQPADENIRRFQKKA